MKDKDLEKKQNRNRYLSWKQEANHVGKNRKPGSLFHKIRSWFFSESSHETPCSGLRTHLLRQYTQEDVFMKISELLDDWNDRIEQFLQQYGLQSKWFIHRYVDPVLMILQHALVVLRSTDTFSREDRIALVELVPVMQNPLCVEQKIAKSVVNHVIHAVEEDLAFLQSYAHDFFTDQTDERCSAVSPSSLASICSQLESLKASPRECSLGILFEWKCRTDLQRQKLHDIGVQLIDSRSTP